MNYRQMQAELKKRGINAKGTEAELRQRLAASDAPPSPRDVTVVDEAELRGSAIAYAAKDRDNVEAATPEFVDGLGAYDTSAAAATTTRQRALDLVVECNVIMSGLAQAKYDDNNPKCIEFHGGPRRRQDVTLAQPDKSIYHFARSFVARTAQDLGSVDGQSNTDQALFDALQSMSTEQKNDLIKSLR